MYPVNYEVDFVERRSRLSTFFRVILAIPWMIVAILWGLAALVAAVLAWFAIVVTGRYPQGLYDLAGKVLRFTARTNGFLFLMTDAWPPFGGADDPNYPIRVPIAPPLERYSRWKTGLRFILLIPLVIVLYLVEIVVRAITILAWLAIVILGRLPRGLFNVMRFGQAYETRATAYQLLIAETYPPFATDEIAAVTPLAPPPPATPPPGTQGPPSQAV